MSILTFVEIFHCFLRYCKIYSVHFHIAFSVVSHSFCQRDVEICYYDHPVLNPMCIKHLNLKICPKLDPSKIRQWTDADKRHSSKSGHNPDSIGNKRQYEISPYHALSTVYRSYNTSNCYDFDPLHQNMSGHSPNYCKPTRQHQLSVDVSPMLRYASYCWEWFSDFSWPFPVRRTLVESVTNRIVCVNKMIGNSW